MAEHFDREDAANEALALSVVIHYCITAQNILEDLRFHCERDPKLRQKMEDHRITIYSPEWEGMPDQLAFLGIRQRELIRGMAT